MKFALLLLLLLPTLASAHERSVRFIPVDPQLGDEWELRIESCSCSEAYQPLEPTLVTGDIHWATYDPELTVSATARTLRGGVASVYSAPPTIFVPEPPKWAGLLAGIVGLLVADRCNVKPCSSHAGT